MFTCITGQPKMVTGVNTNPLEPDEDITTIRSCDCPPKETAASGSSFPIGPWESAIQGVGQLRTDIEDLKKVNRQIGLF